MVNYSHGTWKASQRALFQRSIATPLYNLFMTLAPDDILNINLFERFCSISKDKLGILENDPFWLVEHFNLLPIVTKHSDGLTICAMF